MPSPIRTTLALLSFAGLSCRAEPAALTAPRVVVTPQGLEQTVRLSPADPAPGDTLEIASIVVNGTAAPVDVASRICGLDLETPLPLTNPFISCAGYSVHGALAPGDSLQGFDRRVVSGLPGTYTLRVRHLLNPDVWVEVPVTVRTR
jgi:hypothetical protein